MVTRQTVLLCTVLWRAINPCHLGIIGCTYCSLFMCLWHLEHTVSHTVSMNESHMSLSSLVGSLCGMMFVSGAHPLSVGTHSHLRFVTYTLHLLAIPTTPSLPVLLSFFAKYCTQVPHRGWQQAGMPITNPCPPLRMADVTAPLPGDSVRHINTFTYKYDFSPTSN